MNIRDVLRRLGKPRGDFGLLTFKFRHPRFHGRLIQAVLNRRHDACNGLVDLRQCAVVRISLDTLLAVLAIDMRRIGGHGGLDLVGRYEPVGDARQCATFKAGTLDRPIVGTGAAPMMADTAIAVADDDRIGSAADGAFEKAREQIGRTPRVQERTGLRRLLDPGMALGKRRLLALGRLPHLIADDAKVGHLVPDPFGLGIEAGNALAAAWIGHIMFVVPDADADIKLVVDDPGAAPDIAADARVAPCKPLRAEDAIGVEIARDGERALAVGKLAEDTFDDRRLRRIDFALAAHQLTFAAEAPDHAIAITHGPRRESLLDAPAQAAMRLLGEVFEEQRVHRALEPDMKLADLAFGERNERHARELEMLEQRRDIGLIARYPVKRFGEHDIELARLRVSQQLLDARAQDHARARDRGILEAADNLPSLALGALATDTLLVGDRCRTLLVGGIAGIERGADHGIVLSAGERRRHRPHSNDDGRLLALRVNARSPCMIYGGSLSLAAFLARICSRAICRPIASATRVSAASTAAGSSELSFAAVRARERGDLSFLIPDHHRMADCHCPHDSGPDRRSSDRSRIHASRRREC